MCIAEPVLRVLSERAVLVATLGLYKVEMRFCMRVIFHHFALRGLVGTSVAVAAGVCCVIYFVTRKRRAAQWEL